MGPELVASETEDMFVSLLDELAHLCRPFLRLAAEAFTLMAATFLGLSLHQRTLPGLKP